MGTIGDILAEQKRQDQNETKSVLDHLRKTRKARGGVGAPLIVPAHLQDASMGQGIVITDADLALPGDENEGPQEQDDDEGTS